MRFRVRAQPPCRRPVDLRAALVEGEVHRLVAATPAKPRVLRPLAEEIAEGLLLIPQHLVKRLTREYHESFGARRLPVVRIQRGHRHPSELAVAFPVGSGARLEHPVPDVAGDPEQPVHGMKLFASQAKPDPVRAFNQIVGFDLIHRPGVTQSCKYASASPS